MIHLVHVHSDVKFVFDTQRFHCDEFRNQVLFINSKKFDRAEVIRILDQSKFEYQLFDEADKDQIIQYINQADGMVVNDLDRFKSQLILERSPRVKVFLRLFGYELYSVRKEKYLSRTSMDALYPILKQGRSLSQYLTLKYKRWMGKENSFPPGKQQQQRHLYEHIDAVLLVSQQEYDDLRRYFYLPPLVVMNAIGEKYMEGLKNPVDLSQKLDTLIIGNNKSEWNNHLDIHRLIRQSKTKHVYNYVYFFSYGSHKAAEHYVNELKRTADSHATFIEQFLSNDEFNQIYRSSSALVINSYRQNALANIFNGILTGNKVYLSHQSSTYHWLKEEGFIIFDIRQLPQDLRNHSIRLTAENYQHNLSTLQRFITYRGQKQFFIERIISILTKK